MSKRFDIMAPRPGRDDKTFWARIGTAWQNDKGSIQLVFDALPIPDKEGRVVANLFEPRENNARGGTDAKLEPQRQSRQSVDDMDDEIPFISSNGIW